MAQRFVLTSLHDLYAARFDTIIDARAPAEYAEDHLPGAINLPVLSDAERAMVGTIYTRESRFLARKIGAARVARNVAHHLETALADKPGGWRPLVYCWRGGQRSGAFSTILEQVGWPVHVLERGYKSYRAGVSDLLYASAFPAPVRMLSGLTGTAKTAILHRLAARGVQVIDLEGLAGHRGSVFGAMTGGQPSQKGFESALAAAILHLDPARPVVVEAESNRIGTIRLPPSLWASMIAAPRIVLRAPLCARGKFLITEYADIIGDPDQLARVIEALSRFHSAEVIAQWRLLAGQSRMHELAESLMRLHYDPRYARSEGSRDQEKLGQGIALSDLSAPEQERAAALITAILDTATQPQTGAD